MIFIIGLAVSESLKSGQGQVVRPMKDGEACRLDSLPRYSHMKFMTIDFPILPINLEDHRTADLHSPPESFRVDLAEARHPGSGPLGRTPCQSLGSSFSAYLGNQQPSALPQGRGYLLTKAKAAPCRIHFAD